MHVDDVLVGVYFMINQHNKNSFIMKKVLFIAVAAIATFAFSSCKTSCTCTEAETGVETTVENVDCDDYEDVLNDTAEDQGYDWQDWKCK